ncbi:MFS transporter [Fredinandcohnia onubensis]|uniref:MFS transporter n=1 Tax=Fredinandcohnia onubensis TaxID=1571209 RepID=UPI0015D4A026|nr:MFS transporter [Fredinandcohnia onubensis]
MLETKSGSLVKHQKLFITAITLGTVLNPLNTSMITVALPEIQHEFSLTASDITWLIASYFIVCAIFLPLVGKLSDFYGRKKIFLIGLLLVSISSLLAPLSQNMLTLLGMRAIQAVGTSALFPAGIGMVRSYIKKNQNRVIGSLSVFATTSSALGPTISGLLITHGGWKVIFYVNLPIIALSAILAFFFIPKDQKNSQKTFKWDGMGIISFSFLITLWIYFLQTLKSGIDIWALAGAIVLSFVFYFVEKKKSAPFIDVVILKENPNISLVFVQYIFATLIFFAILLSMPTYLQTGVELSPRLTGILMLSLSIFSMIITPIATCWIEKVGYRIPLLSAVLLGLAGVILLMTVAKSSPLYLIVIVLATVGLSNGILHIGLQTLLYSFVSVSESGTASGLFLTSRFIGNILASSVFGLMFATGVNDTNLNWLAIILIVISVILIPGILYVTKSETKKTKLHSGDFRSISDSKS